MTDWPKLGFISTNNALRIILVLIGYELIGERGVRAVHPLIQICQSQIHRGPKKQIGYNPRAGLVQCLLKHIEMIARSLLNQDLTLCII